MVQRNVGYWLSERLRHLGRNRLFNHHNENYNGNCANYNRRSHYHNSWLVNKMNVSSLVSYLEKERVNAKFSFIFFFFIACSRIFLEIFLIGLEKTSTAHIIHNLFYFFFTLLLGVFFISLFAKESRQPKKIFNIVLSFYPLLLLPPILDYLLFGGSSSYEYFENSAIFFSNFTTLFLSMQKQILGFIVEGLLMCTLAASYVFIKTRSLFRAVATFLIVYAIISVTAVPSAYIPEDFRITHEGYAFTYLTLSIFVLALLYKNTNPKKFSALVKNFRFVRVFYFALLAIFGALLAEKINAVNFIASLLVIFFVRQFSVILNDIFDRKIDETSNPERPLVKKIFNERDYFELGILFLLLAMVYSLLINSTLSFIVVAVSVFSILLYSVPPFHLKNKIYGTAFVGFGSAMTFLFGYVSQVQTLPINDKIFFVTLLIFIAISLGDVIKDFKDYEGERKENVKTLFTVFGLKKGKKISLYLLFASMSIPLFIFHQFVDFLFFPLVAILATLDFRKNEKHERVLFYSFLVFFYCFLRMRF